MSVAEVLAQYRKEVSDSNKYLLEAFRQNPDGDYFLEQSHRKFIVDAAVLKFFKAWETFLETIFKCFLLGEPTLQGTTIKTYAIARDEDHAVRLLVGINTYFDWSNHEKVIQLSKLYLEETNIVESEIKKIVLHLKDLKIIRNAAAHLTATTRIPLESLYQRLTGKQIRDIDISKVISLKEPNTTLTYWDFYQKALDIVAENIANG